MQHSSISNVSNVTNVIGRVGEGELDNGDIYQTNNYVAKNKLNRANIDKFNKYYNNISDDDSKFSILGNDLENINLLRRRINSNNFMPDYKLVKSFDDINFTEDDFIINFYNYINKDKYNLKKINYDYKNEFNIILRNLIKGKVYKIIFRWQSIDSDNFGKYRTSFTTSPSFFIYSGMDVKVVLYKFINYLNITTQKYGLIDKINLDIFIKEWISFDELNSFDKVVEQIKKSDIEYKNKKEQDIKDIKDIKYNYILNSCGLFDNDLLNNKKKFNLALNINGINYGNKISIEDINISQYLSFIINLHTLERDNEGKIIYNKILLYNKVIWGKSYIIKVEHTPLCNKVYVYLDIKDFDIINLNINNPDLFCVENWFDYISYDYVKLDTDFKKSELVNRISYNTGQNIHFIDNKLNRVEITYNSKKLNNSYKDFDKDNNIGSIDIETYNNYNGDVVPYCIGFKTEDNLYISYIDDFESCDDMILNCIDNICIPKNHNIKLYAHNMSEFDGIIILKSLIKTSNKHDYNMKIFSDNDGNMLSLDIYKKLNNKKKIKISILDSCKLLPVNLDFLAKVFNSEVKKGIFPYDFVSSDTIKYMGNVPDFKYFDKINYEDYLKYCETYNDSIWDCKKESLFYLEKDLISLFNVVMAFNKIIYNKFKVNITRVRTISGLAFIIFTSNYYDDNKTPIYFTKGKIEKFIRKSYVGGIVDLYTQYTDNLTYKYDVNSHYPNAMLNPLPGGKPTISSEKNLDKIFGFVEAIVEAPTEQELRVAILPVKVDGKTVLFRNTVRGIWFSEELKMAVSYGYKIKKIISCVQFNKVEGTFDKYINNIYEDKKEADINNNQVFRFIFKLLLNSLYGRLGIREKECKLSLVEDAKLEKLLHTEQSDVLFKYNNLNLVKSSGPLDPELIKIIKDEKLYVSDNNNFNAPNPWGGTNSSVQYSAAVTAYARMYLNKFKNIPDNLYLGGDTDSIIMSKQLDDIFIGQELGKFKLECIIKEGFYHSKKFYLLKTIDDKIIIKAKGINNSNNLLNFSSFIELFKGNNLSLKQVQFNKNLKTLDINISTIEKEIKGISDINLINLIKHKYKDI